MNFDVLKSLGQIAGLGGIVVGIFLLIARDIIGKNIFPGLTKAQAARVLLVVAVLAWSIAIIGVGAWVYVSTRPSSRSTFVQLAPSLPGDTGWVFGGYFNSKRSSFIEGPYVAVQNTTSRGRNRFVEIGDTVALRVSRELIILDFKRTAAARKLDSPITKGVTDDADRTGLTLPAKSEWIVRDVSQGHWPNNPNVALWLRIVKVPS